ncbi:MAG: ImmA/IrrE family metallo-endopeptidase [Ignavibacteriales bacterium]|nr:ImmA/IrrE family metallo-endopeptidase [Ignavibacteriales bacterium]
MKMEINVNTDILVWAIERAGYNLEEISLKVPNIFSWISGDKKPTLKQLEKFAQKTYLPFGYLFLDNPPIEKNPIPFFRTEQVGEHKISLNVYDSILIAQERQEWLANYLKENEYLPLDFVGRFKSHSDIKEIVKDIRTTLNLSDSWASEFPNWEKAREYLTQVIEEVGVIISSSSIVGNNVYRKIKVNECRGFVLIDNYVPFMFINSSDSKSAQLFTIAHEIAHIWIGESAGFDFRNLQPANNHIELLCNKIAAELLVPSDLLKKKWDAEKGIEYLAREFKVSQIVIARRLLDLNKLNKNDFFKFYNNYINLEVRSKETGNNGGDFYSTAKKRLNKRFLYFVNQAVNESKLLIRDAYRLTGLRGGAYNKLIKEHLL